MKVRSSKLSAKSTGYQNYFEAFIDKKATILLTRMKSSKKVHSLKPFRT